MEVGSVDNIASPSTEAQVSILNKVNKQQEAVVGAILEGAAESAPRVTDQTGQRLNVAA